MCSLSVSTRGTTEQKVRWAFSIYDVNGDGFITKQGMFLIVNALYKTMGDNPEETEGIPNWDELKPKERTLKVFRTFDSNGDGVLSLSEFIEGAMNDKTLALILEQGAKKTSGVRTVKAYCWTDERPVEGRYVVQVILN